MNLKKTPNGYYHFRFRVPFNDKELFGNKNEIVKSLRTKNRTVAAKMVRGILNNFHMLKELLLEIESKDINTIVTHWFKEQLKAFNIDTQNTISPTLNTKEVIYQQSVDNVKSNLNKYKKELLTLTDLTIKDNSEASEKLIDENNKQSLIYKLLQANVQLLDTLSQKNKANSYFNSSPHTIKRISYQEAVDIYLPILLNKAKVRAKHKLQQPKQYVVTEKFFKNRFLQAMGSDTLLPERSGDCLSSIKLTFSRKDETIPRDIKEYIKAFYLWLFDNQLIPTNIAKDFVFESVEKIKRKAFTPKMVQEILTKSEGEINLFFRLYLYSGMRRSELFNSEFNSTKSGFIITKGKNKNALRFIPQHEAIKDITPQQIEKLKDTWVPDTVGRILNNWIKENITTNKAYSLHSTRHCFNTAMENAKINRSLMKTLMGHEDTNNEDMSDYYTTYFESEQDKLNAVNSVRYL